MASPCEVLIEDAPEALARQIAETAAACAWRIERKFSRYRSDGVVHMINSNAGRPVVLDEESAALIDFAATLTTMSEGGFDITSGVLRKAWTFDGGSAVPTQAQIDEVMTCVGWRHVQWRRPVLRLKPGMQIDLGGIGKEYAVDLAAARVEDIAPGVSCLINFGGDVVARHPRRDGQPWRVGIEAAAKAGTAVRIVHLTRGGLATSGDSRRFVLHQGRRYSHIIDARIGWPVRDAPHSITVAADTCTQAGTLTTLAMLKGMECESFLRASGAKYWIQACPASPQ
ncbi:FAD:protein FMN transferase [Peristeroidobacter agariperforans]|uniref:FAD:protein FMN transferase n=1 Tax=Peristeroidobacter agariperforans TaxID=268404 RepID=UPI00101C1C89|nr:FAD:protein FMN transferase [Peristeroidobacter agariperforans]